MGPRLVVLGRSLRGLLSRAFKGNLWPVGLVICGFSLAGRRWIIWAIWALFTVVSAGTGAISGKRTRDTIGLGKGAVVLVVIVGVQGSFGLGCGEFVGLMTSRLFLGLFTETSGFGLIWGSPSCNRLSRTLNRDEAFMPCLHC